MTKSDKIKVVYIITPNFGENFSGQTHFIFSLLSGWKDDKISLNLWGTKTIPTNINSGERSYKLRNRSIWKLAKRLNRWDRIKWSLKILYLIIKKRKDFDIVHFHSLGWGALLSPIITKVLRKKSIFTMSLMGSDNPSNIFNQKSGPIQIALLRKFDGAIGLSNALENDAKKFGFSNVICLPNFLSFPKLEESLIDLEINKLRKNSRKKLMIEENSQILLFVGSIIYRKGIDTLIDIFIDLSKSFHNLSLFLIGPDSSKHSSSIEDNFINDLKTRIIKEGLEKRVYWIGIIEDQDKLIEYYQAADIFVFPSRNEGLGNVLIEASACGLPIVSSHLIGITDEVVINNKTGFLISPNDYQGYVESIRKLLNEPDLRMSFGKKGKQHIKEKFNFNDYCKKIKHFYLDVYYNDKT